MSCHRAKNAIIVMFYGKSCLCEKDDVMQLYAPKATVAFLTL